MKAGLELKKKRENSIKLSKPYSVVGRSIYHMCNCVRPNKSFTSSPAVISSQISVETAQKVRWAAQSV